MSKFEHITFNKNEIRDEDAKYLSKCQSLDLRRAIYNSSIIKEFQNILVIDLQYDKTTEIYLPFLKSCKKLILRRKRIINEELNISNTYKFRVSLLKHLPSCKSLQLSLPTICEEYDIHLLCQLDKLKVSKGYFSTIILRELVRNGVVIKTI